MDFQTEWKSARRYGWLLSALGVLSASFLLSSVLRPPSAYLYLPVAAVLAAALALAIRRRANPASLPGSDAPQEELRRRFDRCARRSVNWLLIAFWEAFGLTLGLIGLAVNSKAGEVAESLSSHLPALQLAAFFLVKNLLLLRWLSVRGALENRERFRRETRFVLFSSLVYWLAAVGLYYAFEKVFVLSISAFATGVFAAWIVLCNFTRINRFTYAKKRPNRAVIAVLLLIALAAGVVPPEAAVGEALPRCAAALQEAQLRE